MRPVPLLLQSRCNFATWFRRQSESREASKISIKSCGIVLFKNDWSKFLLLHRFRQIDFPKGAMEQFEDERQAALRELGEEAGISADQIIIDPLFRFEFTRMLSKYESKRYHATSAQKNVVLFLAQLKASSVDPVVRTSIEHLLGYEWRDWNPPHTLQPGLIDTALQSIDLHFQCNAKP